MRQAVLHAKVYLTEQIPSVAIFSPESIPIFSVSFMFTNASAFLYENDVHFLTACDKSCEENCTGPGNKACLACKTGYEMIENEGCQGNGINSLI